MNPGKSPPPGGAHEEVSALIETLHETEQRLEELTVAEGVETEEQARLLRALKCNEMQGYLFSKPVPSEIFETRFLTPVAAG